MVSCRRAAGSGKVREEGGWLEGVGGVGVGFVVWVECLGVLVSWVFFLSLCMLAHVDLALGVLFLSYHLSFPLAIVCTWVGISVAVGGFG